MRRPPGRSLSDTFDSVLERVGAGEAVLGERLLLLGSGGLPVPGAVAGAIALDETGGSVLIVAAPSIESATPDAIASELDAFGEFSQDDLEQLDPHEGSNLAERHASFFALDTSSPKTPINARQRVMFLVERPPSLFVREDLTHTLGERLGGIFTASDGRIEPLPTPDALRPATEPPAGASPRAAGVPPPAERRAPPTWIGVAAIVAGLAIVVFAILRGPGADGPARSADDRLRSPFRDVATGVPADATDTNLVGQRRIVATSEGQLLAFFSSADGLHLVADQRNQGRTWRSPVTIAYVPVGSFTVDLDGRDDLHVASSDGRRVSYARLSRNKDGVWRRAAYVELDGSAASAAVHLAWDGTADVAHVVWARETDDGERPVWAAVSLAGKVVGSGPLAPAGDDAAVLINVATALGSPVVVTYRRGDSETGWFSRSATRSAAAGFEWAPEQEVLTEAAVAAASVAMDADGTAHLALANDSDDEVTYLNKTPGEGWSPGEAAVAVTEGGGIAYPTLSLDSASGFVYLFSQATEADAQAEIFVSLRDPAAGWEGPYLLTEADATPGAGAAAYPTSPESTTGQALVLWTAQEDVPVIRSARVRAP